MWIQYKYKARQKVSSPINENSVLNYSTLCRSKPVKPLFLFRTQIKIFFDGIQELSDPVLTATQLPHSRLRKIVKELLTVWHQWFNLNYMKLRECFLCAIKTKTMTLFNNLFSTGSVSAAHSRKYHGVCSFWPVLHSLVLYLNFQCFFVLYSYWIT